MTKKHKKPAEQTQLRNYTIELRVTVTKKQHRQIKKAVLDAARHAYCLAVTATAWDVKPEIAVYSDSFFSGYEDLAPKKVP